MQCCIFTILFIVTQWWFVKVFVKQNTGESKTGSFIFSFIFTIFWSTCFFFCWRNLFIFQTKKNEEDNKFKSDFFIWFLNLWKRESERFLAKLN
jgi:hypothetical protein